MLGEVDCKEARRHLAETMHLHLRRQPGEAVLADPLPIQRGLAARQGQINAEPPRVRRAAIQHRGTIQAMHQNHAIKVEHIQRPGAVATTGNAHLAVDSVDGIGIRLKVRVNQQRHNLNILSEPTGPLYFT